MTILAIRYNNPGNVSLPIQGWSGGGYIVGAPGQKGYASFPDMATGYAAFNQRLNNYIDVKGYDSIHSMAQIYESPVTGAWERNVSKFSGIGANSTLDTANADQMAALRGGIIRQETGMTPAQMGIDPSVDPNVSSTGSTSSSPFSYSGISPNGFGLDPSVTAPDAAAYGLDGSNQDVASTDVGSFASETPQIYNPADTSITAPLDPGIASAAGVSPTDTSYGAIASEDKQTGGTFKSSQKNNYNYKLPSPDIPKAIDRQSKTMAADTASTDQAIQGAAKTVDQAAKLNAQTGKDIGDKIDSTVKNIFTRGVMVVTGVVFVAGGLWLFAHPDKVEAVIPRGLKPA